MKKEMMIAARFLSRGGILLGLLLWMAIAASPALTADQVRFAVIGDYGADNDSEKRVAEMVKAWQPDFILTLGDNSYVDHNPNQNAFEVGVVKYYRDYIVDAANDPQGERTRFFPSIGNHDYARKGGGVVLERLKAYERAFAVPAGPGGHHYYQFAHGPVRFFALDSNRNSVWKGTEIGSDQWTWWKAAISAAPERWKIVFFHHAPYNSGKEHRSEQHMRKWEFEKSGVTAVLSGHEHVYERLSINNVPFFINGIGGAELYEFVQPHEPDSQVRYPSPSAAPKPKLFAATFVEASDQAITFETWNLKGEMIDRWPANAPPLSRTPVVPVPKAKPEDVAKLATALKPKLQAARYMEQGCATATVPGWNGFETQKCTYSVKDRAGGKKTKSATVVMLNPTETKLAEWVLNACLNILPAQNLKSCAQQLSRQVIAQSGGQFVVAGVVYEDIIPADGVNEAYAFRDGVTSRVEGFPHRGVEPLTSDQLERALSGSITETVSQNAPARPVGVTRDQYLAANPGAAVSGLDWPATVRAEYQRAWPSERNALIEAWLKSNK